ncbi:protein of unknown function [Taphrina deformans PYCC 5710]|uniref:Uncharacterized protein n=1 Tax=Taphrina deformans (strain PYCC 5710 / ATCC 11124 / CBS 356.35 / IMI 108563 / JCM 9778 / NBRC 8474) TaxID=1097556 RepID=R4XEU8_TAPDE|nr:protein of unknown function [Taphrina deformans PYCC 5710]|eukprot:CCG84143.1 protein of unknown function [Taphrina deformans PYCC 5710]
MSVSVPAKRGVSAPAKEVAKISPLLPIAVLLITSAQAYKVLHKHCLANPNGLQALSQLCAVQPGHYFANQDADRATCLLVESFKVAINDAATYTLLLEFCPLVALMMLVGIISANRSSAGVAVRWGTTATYLAMQIVTAAVTLPLYFSLIVWNSSSSARASFVPSGVSRALLPALACGYGVPVLAMMAPSALTDSAAWEWAIASWQIFPIFVSVIGVVLAFCFTGVTGGQTTSDAMMSTTFIVCTMDTVILGSVAVHAYALYFAHTSDLVLSSLIPSIELSSLTQVMHALFTFDFLGCMIAIWTLIFYDTTRFAGVGKTSLLSASFLAIFGTIFLGPGGAAAWAWSNIERARLGALVADRPPKKM